MYEIFNFLSLFLNSYKHRFVKNLEARKYLGFEILVKKKPEF